MKAISIRQPWAWAIVDAGKRVENRPRRWNYRGPILIHASKGVTRNEYQRAAIYIQGVHARFMLGGPRIEVPPLEALDRGGIVGIAELVDCVDNCDDNWFVGPWGLVLRNVRPVAFKPCPGALGLFDVEWP